MSTPTAAGETAPFMAITDPTVAPFPTWQSGIAATWWKTHGRPEAARSCVRAPDSTSAIGAQIFTGTLIPLISSMATRLRFLEEADEIGPSISDGDVETRGS